jgi:hypothetical protein
MHHGIYGRGGFFFQFRRETMEFFADFRDEENFFAFFVQFFWTVVKNSPPYSPESFFLGVIIATTASSMRSESSAGRSRYSSTVIPAPMATNAD